MCIYFIFLTRDVARISLRVFAKPYFQLTRRDQKQLNVFSMN